MNKKQFDIYFDRYVIPQDLHESLQFWQWQRFKIIAYKIYKKGKKNK